MEMTSLEDEKVKKKNYNSRSFKYGQSNEIAGPGMFSSLVLISTEHLFILLVLPYIINHIKGKPLPSKARSGLCFPRGLLGIWK